MPSHEIKSLSSPVVASVDDSGTATVVIATLGAVDSDGDLTEPGFFGQQVAQILPAHDWKSPSLGRARIFERGADVIAELKFNLAVPSARDWHQSIKFDHDHPPSVQEYSYGFTVLDGGSSVGGMAGGPTRYLHPRPDGSPGVRVAEVSPVLMGAGVGTRTLAAKAGGGLGGLDAATRAEMVRVHLGLIRDEVAAALADDQLRAQMRVVMADAQTKGYLGHAYREVAPPAPEVVAAAWGGAGRYAGRFGLPSTPGVRWFAEAPPGTPADELVYTSVVECEGFVFPGRARHEVWLSAGLDVGEAWAVAAHEVAHLAGRDEDGACAVEVSARLEYQQHHRGVVA